MNNGDLRRYEKPSGAKMKRTKTRKEDSMEAGKKKLMGNMNTDDGVIFLGVEDVTSLSHTYKFCNF